jgi:hypothetical protein
VTATDAVNDTTTVSQDTSLNVPWWDVNWTRRQQLTFNNAASTQNLVDFPVLIALDNTRIDYSLTQNQGQDLRFFDADGTPLAYEIESWNESGTSYVWVRTADDLGSTTDSI